MLAASYSNGRVPVRPSVCLPVRPTTSSLKPIGLLNQSIMYFYSGPSNKITSLEVGNNLTGINDNVRERGLEQKCFLDADCVTHQGAASTRSACAFA